MNYYCKITKWLEFDKISLGESFISVRRPKIWGLIMPKLLKITQTLLEMY